MASAGEHIRGVTGKAAGSGINQTSFMFGAIVFAFLFFITTRGDLAKWLGLLGLANVKGKTAPATTPNLSQSSTSSSGTSSPGTSSMTAPNNSATLSLPGVPASQSNMLGSAFGSINGSASGLVGSAGGMLGGLMGGSGGSSGMGDYASLAMLFA